MYCNSFDISTDVYIKLFNSFFLNSYYYLYSNYTTENFICKHIVFHVILTQRWRDILHLFQITYTLYTRLDTSNKIYTAILIWLIWTYSWRYWLISLYGIFLIPTIILWLNMVLFLLEVSHSRAYHDTITKCLMWSTSYY